jgi:prepilin-type N-terminal cleavage/methylation domain-containing protein/prepilin-type processing-associated H-X9-DG protein
VTRERWHAGRGFSLAEVIVVIGIIAVILALVIPSVLRARAASRRVSCLNNFRQLMLAVHNYETENQALPPGVVNPTGPIHNRPEGLHTSWVIGILPHMEQQGLRMSIDATMSVYDPLNAKAATTIVRTLLCPSDPKSMSATLMGKSSYAGCHHDVEAPIDVVNHGVFFLNSRVRHEDITDGSSYTIFFGEKPIVAGDLGWGSGTRATLRNTGTPLNDRSLFAGSDDAALANDLYVGGFGSHHEGGANFGFGDGSVRFLTNHIDPNVYRLLGHRCDGELVDDAAIGNTLLPPSR